MKFDKLRKLIEDKFEEHRKEKTYEEEDIKQAHTMICDEDEAGTGSFESMLEDLGFDSDLCWDKKNPEKPLSVEISDEKLIDWLVEKLIDREISTAFLARDMSKIGRKAEELTAYIFDTERPEDFYIDRLNGDDDD